MILTILAIIVGWYVLGAITAGIDTIINEEYEPHTFWALLHFGPFSFIVLTICGLVTAIDVIIEVVKARQIKT
jgi:hypothetical protein